MSTLYARFGFFSTKTPFLRRTCYWKRKLSDDVLLPSPNKSFHNYTRCQKLPSARAIELVMETAIRKKPLTAKNRRLQARSWRSIFA